MFAGEHLNQMHGDSIERLLQSNALIGSPDKKNRRSVVRTFCCRIPRTGEIDLGQGKPGHKFRWIFRHFFCLRDRLCMSFLRFAHPEQGSESGHLVCAMCFMGTSMELALTSLKSANLKQPRRGNRPLLTSARSPLEQTNNMVNF